MPVTNPWNDDTQIHFYDKDGNPLPGKDGAAYAEIIETVDGIEIRRTYMEPAAAPAWQEPGDTVGEPDAVDFAKSTWDVYLNRDGRFKLVETLPELFAALGWDRLPVGERIDSLRKLRRLPAWNAAPETLKAQADAYLSKTG